MKNKSPLLNNLSGFTLLEVLIALSIFVVVFGAIIVTQINSNLSIENSKKLTIAAMLLKNKMIETESIMQGNAFIELKTEESGTFEGDDEVSEFTWTRTVKEIEFPDLLPPSIGEDEGEGEGPGALMQKVSQMTTNYFNDSLREVTITVTWPTPKGNRSATISTYWVDLTKNVQF